MAHLAKINDEGIVCDINVIDNSDLPNNGAFTPETEVAAKNLQELLGLGGNWKLTSYNGNFRGRYAGVGYTYDEERDQFIPPQPFPSWVLDETGDWHSPVPRPNDGKKYFWNESTLSWELVSV